MSGKIEKSNKKALPVRLKTNATERKGVAFVRDVVENANCVFREIDRAGDYGHDAFVLLVDGEEVKPAEIALQIKAGTSYCTRDECHFGATLAHLNFWSGHPLQTLGVVYDPNDNCAWWVDLRVEAREAKRNSPATAKISFPKAEWNRFDSRAFLEIVLPALLGEAPRVSLDQAVDWLRSDEFETHDLGARVLLSRYKGEIKAWSSLVDAFELRGAESSFSVFRGLLRIMGHSDEGYAKYSLPDGALSENQDRILKFGKEQITELLKFVDDNGYERGSPGYGLFAIFPRLAGCLDIVEEIANDGNISLNVRQNASLMLAVYRHDPDWWALWE